MKDDKEVARMAQAAAADALRNDTLKKRQEAMKFQAVKQGASYEEFKSLVDGAMLKPIKSKEKSPFEFVEHRPGHSRFSQVATNSSSSSIRGAASQEYTAKLEGTPEELASQKAVDEVLFRKIWTALSGREDLRQRFLVNHALTDLKKIFANGLDASLFGHFASLFSAEIDESEDKTSAATHAVGVLEGLARMERFDWTLSFLGSRERSRLTTFMDKASQAGASVDTFRVHARL